MLISKYALNSYMCLKTRAYGMSNGKDLGDRLKVTPLLPRGWSVAGNADTDHTTIYKVQCSASGAPLTCSVVIHSDLTWTLTMGSTSLASHTLQSPRERGSGEVAYNELFCWNAIIVLNAARARWHIIVLYWPAT